MIEINNLTKSKFPKKFLEKIAKIVLKGKKKKELDLSIALVEPKTIKELNRKYRKKNQPTDVLSFRYDNSGLASLKRERSGEIVICPQEVKKNVKIFGSNFKVEMARVLIHGILHLFGYDHEKSETNAKKMKKKEDYYLSQI